MGGDVFSSCRMTNNINTIHLDQSHVVYNVLPTVIKQIVC